MVVRHRGWRVKSGPAPPGLFPEPHMSTLRWRRYPGLDLPEISSRRECPVGLPFPLESIRVI